MTSVRVQFVLIFAQPTQCSSVYRLRSFRRQPVTEPEPMALPLHRLPYVVYQENEKKHGFACELFTIVQVHTMYLLEQTHLRLPRKNPQSRLPRKNPPLCQQKSKTFFTANLMCTKWLTYSNLPPFTKQSQFMHPFYVVTTYQIVLNQYAEKNERI